MESILNVYKLKTLDDLNIAYEELCKQEKSIDERLEWNINNRHHLEARLSQLAHLVPTLKIIENDAKKLENTINSTYKLANDVSAKVRELDLAKSRVSNVQKRVGDLLDLEACAAGVSVAISSEDYEVAAGHIHRFLSMDETVLRHSADSVEKGANIETWFGRLKEAERQIREIIDQNFGAAVKNKDEANIERFFKLFPLINKHEDGLTKFTLYLAAQIREKTEKNVAKATSVSKSDKRAHIVWADAITMLFEEIARVIEVRQPIIETYYMPGHLHIVVNLLQDECDKLASNIIREMQKQRRLNEIVKSAQEASNFGKYSQPGSDSTQKSKSSVPDSRELDTLLSEITLMNARAELYFRFIKRRITADYEVSISDSANRSQKLESFEAKLSRSNVAVDMAVLIGSYTLLEQHYLNESFQKAISLDAWDGQNQTSSLVDDAFYIIKKCVRRAIASGSVDGVCAMINHSADLLERQMAAGFHQTLRKGFPAQGYLDLTQAYSAIQSSIQSGKISAATSDSDSLRQVFLTALNNAETSFCNVKNLQNGFRENIQTAMKDLSPTANAKLDSCISDLNTTGDKFKSVVEFGFSQLVATAIKPKVKAWIESFHSMSHDITEEEFNSYEANDPFSHKLMVQIDSFLSSFVSLLTQDNHNALVENLIVEVAAQLEKAVHKTSFNRFGGLQFDREMRAIAGYLSQVSKWSVREHLARLTQIAILLNLESLSEVSEYSSGNSWRLSASEMKKVLQLRIDFKYEEIQRLKL